MVILTSDIPSSTSTIEKNGDFPLVKGVDLPSVSNGVYFHGIKDMRLGSQEVKSVGSNGELTNSFELIINCKCDIAEVLIKVKYSGICGSDMHFYRHGTIGDRKFQLPVVLGHEPVGTILAIGSDVSNLSVGDRVAMEPNINCGKCKFCKSGHYSICQNCLEIPPRNGFNQEFVVHLAELCHKLPESVSFKDAAVAEPLSCCLHAVIRSNLNPNSVVLINGAGPMGLLTAFAAKAFGASFVLLTDINRKRLDHAKSIGAADEEFLINPTASLEETCKHVKELLPLNKQFNVTIDCTCVESSVSLAIEVTEPGGTVALVGLSARYTKLDVLAVVGKELTIVGSSKMSNEFSLAIDLLAKGKIPAGEVVSHILHYKDFEKGLHLIEKGESSKVLLEF